MKYKEFLEYLESNLEGYRTFMSKARQYQIAKNLKRQQRAAGQMRKWKKLLTRCGKGPWKISTII